MVHDIVISVNLNLQDDMYLIVIGNNWQHLENALHYSRGKTWTPRGQSSHIDYSQQQQGGEEGDKVPRLP